MLLLGFAILALPLLFVAHIAIEYCCLIHTRRYCRKNGLDILRFRLRPELDSSGMKTESTLVDLDCLDRGRRRM